MPAIHSPIKRLNQPALVTGTLHNKLLQLVLLFSLLANMQVNAAQLLTDELALNCAQTESILLACSYRLLIPATTAGMTARSGNQNLEITMHKPYPATDSITAILFLIDTSDPGRQVVINRNAGQLVQIMEKLTPHHRVGLASFDKELVLNVPVGGTASEVAAAARSLTATGLTTELYRNTIRAIETLARTNADRKVIFLLSDGQAEDKAYFHEDVVRAALRYGVIINSLGFPRSIPLSVALQSLRRLSEETGGIYLETDTSFDLQASFLQAPFDNIDRGGQFIIDLQPLATARPDPPEVTINFETSTGRVSASMPVTLMVPPILVAPSSPATLIPATAIQPMVTQASPTLPGPQSNLIDTLLWYGVPIALVILIMMMLIILSLLYRRQPQTTPATNNVVHELKKPLAYLITQDEAAKSFSITTATCRLGRSRDNEITINDSSISRRHAEIRRTFNGQFVLYDRESTNGVFVNNRKISTHKLAEGDIIEIGDVFLRFTQKPVDFHFGVSTAIVKTRAP